MVSTAYAMRCQVAMQVNKYYMVVKKEVSFSFIEEGINLVRLFYLSAPKVSLRDLECTIFFS